MQHCGYTHFPSPQWAEKEGQTYPSIFNNQTKSRSEPEALCSKRKKKEKPKLDPNLSHTDTHTYWQEKALLFKPSIRVTWSKPTQQACHLIGFLLFDGLIVQSLKKHVQYKDVVSEKKKKKNEIFGLMNPIASGVYLANDTISSSPSILYRAVQPQKHPHCVGGRHTRCSGSAFHSQTKATHAFKADI